MMLLMLTIQTGCSLLHSKRPGTLRDGHVGYYHSYWQSLRSIVGWCWHIYTSSLCAPNKTSGRDWQRNSSIMHISTKRNYQGQRNQQDSIFQSIAWYLSPNIGHLKKTLVHCKTAYFQLVCNGCGQWWIRTCCPCTPGKAICSSCFADHIHQVGMWSLPLTRFSVSPLLF